MPIKVKEPGIGETWDAPTPVKVIVPLTELEGRDPGIYPIRVRANGVENLALEQEFYFTLQD
jgi:hypothetical protein